MTSVRLWEALVLDEVLGQDADGLRNVDQRRVGLGRNRRAVGVDADRAGASVLRFRERLRRRRRSGRRAACVRRRWAPRSARGADAVGTAVQAVGAATSTGGSCDAACDGWLAAAVCACVVVALAIMPSAA